MKSSLFAVAFVLLCTNHAFAFDTSRCMDIKSNVSIQLLLAEDLGSKYTKALNQGANRLADDLLEVQLNFLNKASSYSTIYAAFCKD